MKDVGRSKSARQLSVDGDVASVDKVADANFCCHRLRRFVDAAVGSHVRMAIDKSWAELPLGSIDDDGSGRHRQVFTDFVNQTLVNDQVGIFENPLQVRSSKSWCFEIPRTRLALAVHLVPRFQEGNVPSKE